MVTLETWFTSDTHFFHEAVIRYSNRPFSTVEEMNTQMADNWNGTVHPGDTVYHLGDVALVRGYQRAELLKYLDNLNGNIHLCPGNHDWRNGIVKLSRWVSVQDYREIEVDNTKLVLLHYGMRVWNRSHYGSIHLYGHSHGTLPGDSQSVDVGVDNGWEYTPVNLEQIKQRLKELPVRHPVDHLGRGDHE